MNMIGKTMKPRANADQALEAMASALAEYMSGRGFAPGRPDESREDALTRIHGEACTKAQAARILNCSPGSITHMLQDGRLLYACAGDRVDVRSIARYIEAPRAADFEAHKKRICERNGLDPRFAV